MKIILLIGVIFVCTLLGYLFSNGYTKRKKFWEELVNFTKKLELEISYSHKKLSDIVSESQTSYPGLNDFLSLYYDYLKMPTELNLDNAFKQNRLSNDEKASITSFFKGLGKFDKDNQIKELNNYVQTFAVSAEKHKEKHKKYSSLCLKMGFIIGLALAVLIM